MLGIIFGLAALALIISLICVCYRTKIDAKPWFDLESLQQFESQGKLVVAIDGMVYDLTSFAPRHPVGPEILQALRSSDATNAFLQVHPIGLLSHLAPYCIGKLATGRSGGAVPATPRLISPHDQASSIPLVKPVPPSILTQHPLSPSEVAAAKSAFRDFVLSEPFSCVAGKTAFRRGLYRFDLFDASQDDDIVRLHQSIREFITWQSDKWNLIKQKFVTFVAQFPLALPPNATEDQFESLLFSVLRRLNQVDVAQNFAWDPSVSADPTSSRFAFSICGRAFFIVGGFPGSSRNTRQFPNHATIVFNSHAQFTTLRESELFTVFQQAIRTRELTKTFNKCINPNLAEFGEIPEPCQYSGKKAVFGWTFPFQVATCTDVPRKLPL